MKKNIVVAPHPVDELVGVFSLLKKYEIAHVFYVKDFLSDKQRRKELQDCALVFKFAPWILSLNDIEKGLERNVIYYIPHTKDYHPEHKKVRDLFERNKNIVKYELKYYTTEMNTSNIYSIHSWKEKEQHLYSIYPTQKSLWQYNAKYYLFEGISDFPLNTWIEVKFQKEGRHCYPDAPKEVAFLRNEHRHIFYIKVRVAVQMDNRELESLILKEKLERLLVLQKIKDKSCEGIAKEVYYLTKDIFSDRELEVEVHEDNENGVVIK